MLTLEKLQFPVKIQPTTSVSLSKSHLRKSRIISSFSKISGRLTPLIAPMIRLIIIAAAITPPGNTIKPKIDNSCNNARPDYSLSNPIADSLRIKSFELDEPFDQVLVP